MFRGIFIAVAGFQTNFASIPRALWTAFPKMGKWDKASVMHDAGYANFLYTEGGERVYLIKKYSDRLFYDCMRDSGVSLINARIMYSMVKMFGSPDSHPLNACHVSQPSTKLQS